MQLRRLLIRFDKRGIMVIIKLLQRVCPSKMAIEIVFSRTSNQRVYPTIYFNGIEVKTFDKHKHLDLMRNSFAYHINEKISNTRKILGIIKYLSRFLSVKIHDQIFKIYIRPHLDFCEVIYHLPS